MDVELGSVGVRFLTVDPSIGEGWQQLFSGWAAHHPLSNPLTFYLTLTTALPPPPPVPPLFQHPYTGMTVYLQNGIRQFRFPGRAFVNCPDPLPDKNIHLSGRVTPLATQLTLLEDITFTALAPWLRRRGWYLVHAFCAADQDDAILIVGPSHSGKTTTGLRLVLAGRQLYGNDLVLLTQGSAEIMACPTPGQVRIRPGTLTLLPALQPYLDQLLEDGTHTINRLPLSSPANARPVPVRQIFFPEVRPETLTALRPLTQGETLARLAEESLDRWDSPAFDPHLDFLQVLSAQVKGAALTIGQDDETVIDLLAQD